MQYEKQLESILAAGLASEEVKVYKAAHKLLRAVSPSLFVCFVFVLSVLFVRTILKYCSFDEIRCYMLLCSTIRWTLGLRIQTCGTRKVYSYFLSSLFFSRSFF